MARRRRTPEFTGLVIASILLRIVAVLHILLGLALLIGAALTASKADLGAEAIFLAMLPGAATTGWGIFLLAAGEACTALKEIAVNSFDR